MYYVINLIFHTFDHVILDILYVINLIFHTFYHVILHVLCHYFNIFHTFYSEFNTTWLCSLLNLTMDINCKCLNIIYIL